MSRRIFDCAIVNGWVADGTGASRFRADVGIRDGRIMTVGEVTAGAADVIDADGLTVAPGFIDAHAHTEVAALTESGQEASNRQGVTTHVVGQCGLGFAPSDPATFEILRAKLSVVYGDDMPLKAGGIGALLSTYEGRTTLNMATLIPHVCVRMQVGGDSPRELTPAQLKEACQVVDRGMREGAVGLSSGLDYPPSVWGTEAEFVALCRTVAAHGGIYATHVRYSLGTCAAVREAIRVGRDSGIPVHVSHLYSDGSEGDEVLAILDEARQSGLDVTFDTYPYTYWSSYLLVLLPPWALEGGLKDVTARLADRAVRERLRSVVDFDHLDLEWGRARIAGEVIDKYRPVLGKDVLTAARQAGADPVDYVCDLLLDHSLLVSIVMAPKTTRTAQPTLRKFLRHPGHMVGSDGIYLRGLTHPRGYGAFARYLRLTREGLLPLEEAVRHMTLAPAQRYGLEARGYIAPGGIADIVVFDPDTITDRSTLRASRCVARGVKDLLVNGVCVLRDGARTGATPGRGVRRAAHEAHPSERA